MPLRFRFVFLLPVLLFAQSCLVDDDKKAVRVCFEHFQSGVVNGDATATDFCTDAHTKFYFHKIQEHVISSDSAAVAKLPLMDRLLIFGLRTAVPANEMNGKENLALRYAVQYGFVAKSDVSDAVISEIKVDGDSARVKTTSAAKNQTHEFLFRRERDDWKLDLVSSFPETEKKLKEMLAQANMKEDDMIRSYIAQTTGKMPGNEMWLPLK